MDKYIKQDYLLAALSIFRDQEHGDKNFLLGIKSAKEIIQNAPVSDAPVLHGKWEPGNPICPVCGESKFKGLDADIWADWQPPFCPICGAKMSGEDNAID